MRLAILAYNLRVAGGLSVGRNVVAALRRVADQHDYYLIMPSEVGYEAIDKPTRSICHYYRRTWGSLGQMSFEKFEIPRRVRAFKPDVIWGLGNFGLFRPNAKQAILLHQPHLIYGQKYQQGEVWKNGMIIKLARRRLRRCLPAVQLMFCQTKTAAERFRRFFDYEGPIAIMPNAVSQFTLGGAETTAPTIFERLHDRFVLFCLTKYYAHKNLESLVELFRKHAQALHDVVVILTIREDQHVRAPRLIASLSESNVRDHVINVGPLAQEELAAYFTHCDALILPTLLESFSGTYLEAMQYRCPILTSDLDFARDVCGPAASYFDPFSTPSIRDAIIELRDSPAKRRALIEAAPVRAKAHFRDWDSIVREAVQTLESLVS